MLKLPRLLSFSLLLILAITGCDKKKPTFHLENMILDHLNQATELLGKEKEKQAAILKLNALFKQLDPVDQKMTEFRKEHGYKADILIERMQKRLQAKCGILQLALANLVIEYGKDEDFARALTPYKTRLAQVTRFAFSF